MSDLYYLCYKSEMANKLDSDERGAQVSSILESARRRNSASKVTGCLLFTHDYFFQVLEGNEDAVLSTFERIKHDPRHRSIEVLSQGELEKRKFPESWMGFSEHAVSHDDLFTEIGDAIADTKGNLSYAEAMVVLSNVAQLMSPSVQTRAAAS
ncbi:BLUF domain-containing protein [Roseibium sp.]|uniref:BLUF domain-containing protein n=1 Tax=Roseibium sp. TaxID=1936156 RepID=UPI003A97997E